MNETILQQINRLLDEAGREQQAGQLEKAAHCYEQALALAPSHPQILQRFGLVRYSQNRLDEAMNLINAAITADPEQAELHFQLGIMAGKLGQHAQAQAAYQQAVRLRPDYAEAWNNLGLACVELRQYQQAEACYRHAIRARGHYAAAYYNYAVLLSRQGHYHQAIEQLQQANRFAPNNPDILNSLASQHSALGDHATAVDILQQSLHGNPQLLTTRLQLGETCFLQHRYSEAEQIFSALLDQPVEIAKQAYNGLARVLAHTGKLDKAAEYYEQSLTLDPDYLTARENLLFLLGYNAMRTPAAVLEAHQQWNKVIDGASRATTFHWPRPSDRDASRDRKLNIAYISADFRAHPVGYLIEPVLRHHDHDRFVIYCYSNVSKADAITGRLRALTDHWRDTLELDDRALAEKIHQDGIDVLIDLSGHTAGNRLKALACRPAAVQATYLGYCTTTGLTAMDYWITDDCLHPADTEELACEEIFRLPRCWISYQPPANAPAVTVKHSGPVCFGSFNSISKISPQTCATWSEVLHATNQATLFLKCRELGDDRIKQSVLEMFAAHGIGGESIRLEGADKDYLQAYHDVDIALDPFPRTGGATTLDALWMGVPVITLSGRRFIERQGHSILTALGHPEWIATSTQDYIHRAVTLAGQQPQRDALRGSLRDEFRRSPLIDGESLARALESAYTDMWRRYLQRSHGANPV